MSLTAFLALLGSLLKALVSLDERAWKRVTGLVSRLFSEPAPATSCENLSLSISLELLDAAGKRAVIKRVQRVRFLTEDAGVVRDVVWGSGSPLAGYSSTGAKRLGVRHEGSKRVVRLDCRLIRGRERSSPSEQSARSAEHSNKTSATSRL
jgi:hypothetical protein